MIAKGESGDRERVPFNDVFITPLVRDQFGKKMTKSRGNVVDPLEIMDRFGTDAVRFTLAQLTVQGRDLVLSEDRLSASRAFANKIWNAARFVLMNLEGAPQPIPPVETSQAEPRRSMDPEPPRPRDRKRNRGDRCLRIQRRGADRLPVHLARVL